MANFSHMPRRQRLHLARQSVSSVALSPVSQVFQQVAHQRANAEGSESTRRAPRYVKPAA